MSSSNKDAQDAPIDPSAPQQPNQQSIRSNNQHHLIAAATSALASSSTTPPIMINLTSTTIPMTTSTSLDTSSTTSSGPPNFPALSAATTEILKRVVGSQNAAATYGATANTTPGWEAAKQQVLQNMITTSNMPPPTPIPSARRRGRPSNASTTGTPTSASGTPTTGSRGGRGGARGGATRGRKRKRSSMKRESPSPSPTPSSSSHSSAHSSRSTSPTSSARPALPATTKSGRAIHRPTHFDPTVSITPARAPRRRRGPYRRMHEATVCRCCGRGESPKGNLIVFCDGCNAPWHQMCHEPRIELKEGKEGEEEGWWCASCAPGAGKASAGSSVTDDGKRAYLMGLPTENLVDLLILAEGLHPGLPIYPPHLMSVSTPTTAAPAISAPLVSPTTGMFHPKPGHGLRMPPEEQEDVAWLVDDDFVAFSHIYRDPAESGDVEMGDAATTTTSAAATTGGIGEVINVGA